METTTCTGYQEYRLHHTAKQSNEQIGRTSGRFKVRNSDDPGTSILVKVTGPAKLRLNSASEDDVGGEGDVKLIGDIIITPCDTPLFFLLPQQQHLIYIDHEGSVSLNNVQQLAYDRCIQKGSVGQKKTMKVVDPDLSQTGEKKTHKRNVSEGFIVVTGDAIDAATKSTGALEIKNCTTDENIELSENCVTDLTDGGKGCLKSEMSQMSGESTSKQGDLLAEDCVDSVLDFTNSNSCCNSERSGSSSLVLPSGRSGSESSDSNSIPNRNNLNQSANSSVRHGTHTSAANNLPRNIKNDFDVCPQREPSGKERGTHRRKGPNESTDGVLLKDPIRDSFTHLLNCIYLMDLCDHLYQNCIVDMELYQKLFDMTDTSVNERNATRHLLLYLSKRKVNKQRLKKALNDSENYTLVSSFFPEDNF